MQHVVAGNDPLLIRPAGNAGQVVRMLAVVEHEPGRSKVMELQYAGDLIQFLVLAEAVEPRRVAGRAFGRGAEGRGKAAVVRDNDLVQPAVAGAVLGDDLAVAIEKEQVRVSHGSDRADGNMGRVRVDIQAGDALPGERPESAGVPGGHVASRGRLADFDHGIRSPQQRYRRQEQETGDGAAGALYEADGRM